VTSLGLSVSLKTRPHHIVATLNVFRGVSYLFSMRGLSVDVLLHAFSDCGDPCNDDLHELDMSIKQAVHVNPVVLHSL
jgi:hypothetical protein